jgi:CMP-N,N'-diacetyllegionaminic acid synthase
MSKLTDDGVVEPLHPGSVHRRQDLPSLFLHDGAVVAVSRGAMLRGKDNPLNPHAFFGLQRRGIRTEPGETVEIDVQRDLYWAEALLREREQPAASGATGNVVSEQGNDSLRMAS